MIEQTLTIPIIDIFKQKFEWRCMSLLVDAYVFTNSQYLINIDYEEEYISAVLFDFIEKCPQATEWNIDITPEFRLYKREMLKKGKTPKSAPRIDIRFAGWASSSKMIYFVEAKNLIETNAVKKGRKTKISASALQKRYIETGIDNYVSGKYPSNGCLVGYILQGATANIINCLNKCLCGFNRISERLEKQSFELQNFDECYVSTHKDKFQIKHLMLNFTNNK
jgi:hypothetical protein